MFMPSQPAMPGSYDVWRDAARELLDALNQSHVEAPLYLEAANARWP